MKLEERQARGIAELAARAIIVFPPASGEDGPSIFVFGFVRRHRLGVALGTEDEGCFRVGDVLLTQGDGAMGGP